MIATIDPTQVGIYNFQFIATEIKSKLLDSSVMFKVTITCLIANLQPVITENTLTDIKYSLRTTAF